MKTGIVDGYLGRLKTIPCRYFEQSIKDSSPEYKFKCQFGNSQRRSSGLGGDHLREPGRSSWKKWQS
jgi:hypothetical protein